MKKAWRNRVEKIVENGDTVLTGSAIVYGLADGLERPRHEGIDLNSSQIVAGLEDLDTDTRQAMMIFRAFNALGLEAYHVVSGIGRGVLSLEGVTYFINRPHGQSGGLFVTKGEFSTSGRTERVTTVARLGLFPEETRIAADAVIRAAQWGPSDITFRNLDTLGSRAHSLGKDFLSRM